MHKVEIRLTNEGNEDAANVFEVYTEALKDDAYVETVPMQEVSGGGAPIVMFLELNERVIVVAKGNSGRLVFDKTQNANVRVETDEERVARTERAERLARSQADQNVASAQAKVQEGQELAANAERDAQAEVRRAERERAKLDAETAKPLEQPPSETTSSAPAPVEGAQTSRMQTEPEVRTVPRQTGKT